MVGGKAKPDLRSLCSQTTLTHLISLPRQHGPSSNLMQRHFAIEQQRVLEKKGAGGGHNLLVCAHVKIQECEKALK